MTKTRTIVWQALSWPSLVVHRHTVNDGVQGHGLVVGKTDQDIPFAVEYLVTLTSDWKIKKSIHQITT
jgi:hypothetical protein